MHHPTLADLDRYRLDKISGSDWRHVTSHLLWCWECRQIAMDAQGLERLIRFVTADPEALAEFTRMETSVDEPVVTGT